ncbi:MAG: SIR2 family protein [Caulobacterales bacterium]|jgi:hypothetical protein|nr:SIR2 family protein [Caulobacterales bacterium]
MPIELPQKLIEDVARRRCVLYVGAGVSRWAKTQAGKRPPLWPEFVDKVVQRCPESARAELRRIRKAGDLLTCLDIAKVLLKEDWHRLLEEEYSHPQFQIGELHGELFRLDTPITITTNVDKIYEKAAIKLSEQSVKSKTFSDSDISTVARLDHKARIILRAHGSLDNAYSMIFTRQDYATLRKKHDDFYKLLQALLMTHTFLFVGVSMTDPDLVLMLENLAGEFGFSNPHYALIPRDNSPETLASWERNYSLRPILYNPKNDHAELLAAVSQLADAVAPTREDMQLTGLW